MTRLPRGRRAPALFASLAVVGVAAVVLALSITAGSDAAAPTPRPRPVPQVTAPHVTAPHQVARRLAAPAPVRHAVRPVPRAAGQAGDSPGQMYLADTDERRGELIHTWDLCLLDHGATQDTTRPMAVFQGKGVLPINVADPVPAAASAACEPVLPQLPQEENPALNPDYAADSAANVACLRAKGVDVHTIPDTSVFPDGLSWTYDTSTTRTLPHEGAVEKACEIEAFSDH